MNFLSDNKGQYKYQSDFRKFHSANTCSSYLHNKITKGFDSGLVTGIDLQKAFNTIDHNSLKKSVFQVLLVRQSCATDHTESLLSV